MRARVLVACLLGLLSLPALALAAVSAGTKTLTTTMLGSNEVPKGAPKGSGKAVITGYYVNIHTAKYPAGAIRGQL